MQNYWNLYVACKQQQLYGPVNYRDFRETGPRNLNWSGKNTLSLAPCKVIRILESETFLLVECGNLGIHQKESDFRLTRLEFEIPIPLTSSPESTAWTPESKSVRIIFLGTNCWNKVRHTEFLRPITKWELKKMFRTNPEREKLSVKCKDVHEALFTTAFRVSGYCFERFKFHVYLLINIFLHQIFTRYIVCR